MSGLQRSLAPRCKPTCSQTWLAVSAQKGLRFKRQQNQQELGQPNFCNTRYDAEAVSAARIIELMTGLALLCILQTMLTSGCQKGLHPQ